MEFLEFEDDFEENFEVEPEKTRSKGRIALLVIGALLSLVVVKTTLASNISINSNSAIEYGQGSTQLVACSGSQALNISPASSFVNVSGAGAYKLSSYTVSNIPSSCDGFDYTLNFYDTGTTSTPLAIFNSTTIKSVVSDSSTTFVLGDGNFGSSITVNSSSSFTVTFTTPVAATSNIGKIVIQSSAHTKTCAEGATCSLGDIGPGGGTVYYVTATPFTSTGSACNTNCKYLEIAPMTWYNGTSDPSIQLVSNNSLIGASAQGQAIGAGYANTSAFISLDTPTVRGAVSARAYRGGGKTDWSVPSYGELVQVWSFTGSNYRTALGLTGGNFYFSSSESANTGQEGLAWGYCFVCGGSNATLNKLGAYFIRPVRAF